MPRRWLWIVIYLLLSSFFLVLPHEFLISHNSESWLEVLSMHLHSSFLCTQCNSKKPGPAFVTCVALDRSVKLAVVECDSQSLLATCVNMQVACRNWIYRNVRMWLEAGGVSCLSSNQHDVGTNCLGIHDIPVCHVLWPLLVFICSFKSSSVGIRDFLNC